MTIMLIFFMWLQILWMYTFTFILLAYQWMYIRLYSNQTKFFIVMKNLYSIILKSRVVVIKTVNFILIIVINSYLS